MLYEYYRNTRWRKGLVVMMNSLCSDNRSSRSREDVEKRNSPTIWNLLILQKKDRLSQY